jgi:polyisoprenoid-binding protein YceI
MKKMLSFIFSFLLIHSSIVKADTFEMILEHSKIGFQVDYMVMTKVEGLFKKYQGYFYFDPKTNQLGNVRVIVDANSVDSSDTKRDFHLRAQEFFYVAQHPDITFKFPGMVKVKENEPFKLDGELTMRGETRKLTLNGVYLGVSKDPWGKDNYFFNLSGELDRKDYGIVWNKQMDNGGYLVGDVIKLNLVAQAQPSSQKTPFSTHMVPQTKGIKERMDLKAGKIKKLSTPTDPKDHKAPK